MTLNVSLPVCESGTELHCSYHSRPKKKKKSGSRCSSIRMAHQCGSLPINGFEAVVTMAVLDALKLYSSYSHCA